MAQSARSLGAANVGPKVGPVVIAEIMYHPPDLPGGIDNGDDEYVNIATRLARNIGKMAELRSGMRQRMLNSPLTDAVRFTLHLENAYRTVWKDRCGRQAQSTKAQPS